MKILFQGDSITDAARDKRNYHHMGNGYPKFASALIAAAQAQCMKKTYRSAMLPRA